MNSIQIRLSIILLILFLGSIGRAQIKESHPKGELLFKDSHLVYYFDQIRIHPISFPLLDSVVDYLNSNPNVCIEIGNHMHTPPEYSRRPSQPRADEVKRYLIFKGVHPDRLTAVGFGGSEPLIDPALIEKEKDEEKRMRMFIKNHRTEFKIIATDYISPEVPLEITNIINDHLGLEKIAGNKTFYLDKYVQFHDFQIVAITPLTSSFSYCYIFNTDNEIVKIPDFLQANNRLPYSFQIEEDHEGCGYLRTNFLGGGTLETNLLMQHIKISDTVEVLITDIIYCRNMVDNDDLLALNSFEIRSWSPIELRKKDNSYYDALILIPDLFYLKPGEIGYEEWLNVTRESWN